MPGPSSLFKKILPEGPISTRALHAHNAGPRPGIAVKERRELFGHRARQLLHIRNGHGAVVIAGHIMANADGQKLHLPLTLHHGDHVTQVLFQIVGRVHRQGAVIHGRTVRDHHQDLARLRTAGHATMGPFQRLAVNVFLQKALFHHQTQIGARPTPGCIGGFIDDVAQVIQTTGLGRTAIVQPRLTGQPAFPCAGGKAQNFHLHIAALQRAGQNVGANGRNRNGPTAHGA
mmetsp:Transcript_18273/g.29034  ORF Transcript_18273/g.29034 Transcript_18273/m.29034 type:complete len:231 (-) Transcript_18273:2342-3034(-)